MVEFDSDKVETFYLHILKASRKFREKQVARKSLIEQLKQLRSMKTSSSFHNKLDEIECAIQELINKERRIYKAQKEGDMFQADLKKKIKSLDDKLHKFIEVSKNRDSRVKELESKIEEKMQKQDILSQIQGELEGLEIMYHKLKRRNIQAPELLEKISTRIKELKHRIKHA